VSATDRGAQYKMSHLKYFPTRFKLINGMNGSEDNTPKVQTHLAVQEYASAEIFESPEFQAASSTEWRSRVVANTISLDRRALAFAKQ
jgi:hypothetical protein